MGVRCRTAVGAMLSDFRTLGFVSVSTFELLNPYWVRTCRISAGMMARDILKPSGVVREGGGSPQGMVSGPEFSRENRVKHLVKLSESLLLVELPEGLIGHGIVLIRAGNGQTVGGDPAPGNQPMLSAATAQHQVVLKECGHVRSAK